MADLGIDLLRSIEEADKNQWDNLVESADHASIFHLYDWLNVIEKSLDVKPYHLVVKKNGNPVAIQPNFVSSLKLDPIEKIESISLGFGGMLILSNKEESITLILRKLDSALKPNVVYSQISTYNQSHIEYNEILKQFGYRQNISSCRFEIDVTRDYDEIVSEFDKGRRKDLKKAESQNYVFKNTNLDEQSITKFYNDYERTMERVGGKSYPIEFFNLLPEHFSDHVKLFTIEVDGESVGSFLYFLDKYQSVIQYYFSAVNQEHFEYYPTILLHCNVMKWAQKNGIDTYDFGGTNAHFDNGVFRYKRQFGGEIKPILSWKKYNSVLHYAGFRIGEKTFELF